MALAFVMMRLNVIRLILSSILRSSDNDFLNKKSLCFYAPSSLLLLRSLSRYLLLIYRSNFQSDLWNNSMSRKVFNPSNARRIEALICHEKHESKIPGATTRTMMLTTTRTMMMTTTRWNNSSFVANLETSADNYISPLDKQTRQSAVDVSDFERVAGIYDEADQKREIVIKTSRDIVKGAKKAIYDLHRSRIEEAKAKIRAAEAVIDRLAPTFQVLTSTSWIG